VKQRDKLKVVLQHYRLPDEGFALDDPENDDDIVVVLVMVVVVVVVMMMIKISLFSCN
jgi:hypothetical protein